MKNYNIIDLFCGTGGFSHGFINSSETFKLACAIDILKIATSTCKANNPDSLIICGDIRKSRPSAVHQRLKCKNVDLIVGGPPCQGFSSLRPFRSSDDEDPRNSLFENFASFVNHFRPKVFVMENVVGLLTHKNGDTLNQIQTCFDSMGYRTDWRVLNAANYGVPQKRERFILIGVQAGGRISFPQPTHAFNGRSIGYRDKNKMITDVGDSGFGPLFNQRGSDSSVLPKAISVMDAIGDLPAIRSGEQATTYNRRPETEYQRQRRKSLQTLTLHEAAKHSPKILEIIRHAGENINCIPKHLVTSGFSSCYSRLSPEQPAVTITVKFMSASSNKCIHPRLDRTLTPREAARLQSFDDDFIFCGHRTDIVTQIGNAVPPLLGEAIARSVLKILG